MIVLSDSEAAYLKLLVERLERKPPLMYRMRRTDGTDREEYKAVLSMLAENG